VKEDIMVKEKKKDEDHLLAVGVESSQSHNGKTQKEWENCLNSIDRLS